jgi:hypothetical protein
MTGMRDRNAVLLAMQQLQNLYCAIWTEAVWALVDATLTQTKFIISDHPITVYNRDCFPNSQWCREFRDPDIRCVGTHTIFPLSPTRALVLTNHSWVRNPHASAIKWRPNPNLFRSAIFYYPGIQTGRELTEVEINQVNFIIKKRAYRHVAATEEEWLYPESRIPSEHWRKLDVRYLLMPDPRSVTVSEQIVIGYDDRRADAFDSYGRRPGQPGYKDEHLAERERKTHYAFQGEFARMFGPKRRGISFNFGALDKTEDSPEFHQWHLSLEKKIIRPGTVAKLSNRAKKRKQRHEHRNMMNPRRLRSKQPNYAGIPVPKI